MNNANAVQRRLACPDVTRLRHKTIAQQPASCQLSRTFAASFKRILSDYLCHGNTEVTSCVGYRYRLQGTNNHIFRIINFEEWTFLLHLATHHDFLRSDLLQSITSQIDYYPVMDSSGHPDLCGQIGRHVQQSDQWQSYKWANPKWQKGGGAKKRQFFFTHTWLNINNLIINQIHSIPWKRQKEIIFSYSKKWIM